MLNQDVKIDLPSNATKKEKLAKIDEKLALTEEKRLLFSNIESFLMEQGSIMKKKSSKSAKKELFEKLTSFVQAQDIDTRIKNSTLEYFKLEFEDQEYVLAEKILREFPTIQGQTELSTIYIRYLKDSGILNSKY